VLIRAIRGKNLGLLGNKMAGNIIHLIGFPGVGKLTIAKEIARLGHYVLIDNHKINNPVFSLIGADGKTPLPKATWTHIQNIWNVIYDVMETLSPPRLDFVMTNALIEAEDDHAHCNRLKSIAAKRGGIYVPVLLSCDLEEHQRRVVQPDRAANYKDINPDTPVISRERGSIKLENDPHCIMLDVTRLSPDRSASIILEQTGMKLPLELKHESHHPHHP
jgi:Fe-S-cluster formation regulator IscX/YfhJ